MSSLTIGTRGSDLALWQAEHIKALLAELGVDARLLIIKTQGDRIDDVPFSKLEGKGFFTKELEDAQLDGRVDLAVHSLKDLATESPSELAIAALVGREDARELLLVSESAADAARETAGDLLPLKDGASIGTSAVRRQEQLRLHRPDLRVGDLRGNVPTRVNKLRRGDHDAIIIARAGVLRLKLDLDGIRAFPLPIEGFVPAPGQGMLAIQCRNEPELMALLGELESSEAAVAVKAERELLTRLEGGCQLPFGVHVREHPEAPGGWRLNLFLKEGEGEALILDLHGADPTDLSEAAWKHITDKRAEG